MSVPLAAAAIGGLFAGVGVYALASDESPSNKSTETALSLPTDDALLLRVVATPWAHVLVDGKHRETTPFAQPIHLEPGKHVVRMEHPHAAPEERVVEGTKGQAVLLNVQMHVEKPLSLDLSAETPEEDSP